MKKRRFSTTVFIAMMLCVAMSFTACGNKVNSSTAVEETEPDSRFADIDSLAEFMAQQFTENATPSNLESNYQACSDAMMSHWALSHKGEDENAMTDIVFNELKDVAGKLAEGSTVDMMRSGEINCAVAQYHTAKVYCDENRGNPLYQAEMSDWLQLENELSNFYGELATLANWDGTISKVIASGSRVFVAESRDDDYSQLKKGGNFAGSDDMTIAEARANLIQELEDAKSLEDDLVDDPNFKKTLQSMRERADRIVPLLDEWLAARAELGNAEAIPEAHTAHFIEKMGQQIMKMIE
ncbi:MAG: hypothetical protein IJK41_03130 [Muribaculaceae bacterium]|nr:hypothetical protein [Muribaculaceae bacterium]